MLSDNFAATFLNLCMLPLLLLYFIIVVYFVFILRIKEPSDKVFMTYEHNGILRFKHSTEHIPVNAMIYISRFI